MITGWAAIETTGGMKQIGSASFSACGVSPVVIVNAKKEIIIFYLLLLSI